MQLRNGEKRCAHYRPNICDTLEATKVTNPVSTNDKPRVWLVGNSLISEVDPNKISGILVVKHSAMTLDDRKSAIRKVPALADIVVIQSLTNDVKFMMEEECV